MPLVRSCHPFPGATFAVWQMEEEEHFFQENLLLSVPEKREMESLKGPRRREWLAVRWLLHQVSGRDLRLPLAKDAFSKPFFPAAARLACSLSHSQELVGALLVEQIAGAVGCDLQVLVAKMPRLAPKFLNTRETEFVQQHHAAQQFELIHLIWTAKESLYKAYGIKELDFRVHLHISPFEWNGISGSTSGSIIKNDFRQDFQLYMEKSDLPALGAYVWTVCTAN